MNAQTIALGDYGNITDGYHTFNELYEHRHLLYLAFLKYHRDHQGGWKARLHQDGSAYDGWFLVGTELNGKQISYHLPDRLWDKAWWLPEYDRAPVEFDGHTSDDVLQRLSEWLDLPENQTTPMPVQESAPIKESEETIVPESVGEEVTEVSEPVQVEPLVESKSKSRTKGK